MSSSNSTDMGIALYYNPLVDIPAHLPAHDKQMIRSAHSQHWGDIKPEKAESREGRQILHAIAVHGYHNEEASNGMI